MLSIFSPKPPTVPEPNSSKAFTRNNTTEPVIQDDLNNREDNNKEETSQAYLRVTKRRRLNLDSEADQDESQHSAELSLHVVEDVSEVERRISVRANL